MDSVVVNGLRIAYLRVGSGGAPVVLLGGFVGGGEATWRHQIDALATSHMVVTWDAPGSGESSDPPESFRLPDYADCLAGLMSELNLGPSVVVGLSFGGALAIEFFRRPRAQVRGLFLAGASPAGPDRYPPTRFVPACSRASTLATVAVRVREGNVAEHVLGRGPNRAG